MDNKHCDRRIPVEQQVEDTPVETIPEEIPSTKEGVVTDCLRLNIRKEPSMDAKILCVVDLCTTLKVDMNRSTDEWFSVCTENGVEGFCMKKYVTIKR